MPSPPSPSALSSLLREVAPLSHPRRAELLVEIADALESGARNAISPQLIAIASDERAPSVLRTRDEFTDTGWADLSGETKKEEAKNRAIAKRLVKAGGGNGDATSRLARCLGFSFTWRGLPTFHMLRFACGFPACFADHFNDGDLGEVYGPVLGPSIRSRQDFARFLVEFMKADSFAAEGIASTVWHASRNVGLFPKSSYAQMEDALDAWLLKTVPNADSRKAATDVLRILGLPAADARALVSLAPKEQAPKASPRFPSHEQAPEVVELAPSKNFVRMSFPVDPKMLRDPWMKKLGRLTPMKARELLSERWSAVPNWLRHLRASILDGELLGMVVGPAGTFVEIMSNGGREMRYIASPVSSALATKTLRSLGITDTHPLFEFVVAFGGLREAPPDHAGGFLPVAEFAVVERARRRQSSVISLIEADELRDWRDALVVYEDWNGDALLVSPKGPIGWAKHDAGCVESCGKSFKDFFKTNFR